MRTNHHCDSHAAAPASGQRAVDSVGGLPVAPVGTPLHIHHEGQDHHFCADPYREPVVDRLDDRIEAGTRPEEGQMDVIYTCPMHPEIEQIGPGVCPICGMALEPRSPTTDEGPIRGTCRHAPALHRVGAVLTRPAGRPGDAAPTCWPEIGWR